MPEKISRFAKNMTLAAIEEERNIEIRRRMIDIYGLERFVNDSGAIAKPNTPYAILYKKELPGQEAVAVVRVKNSTPEPDGSIREYFIRVPPAIQTAHAAVAWTFGLTSLEYEPEVET